MPLTFNAWLPHLQISISTHFNLKTTCYDTLKTLIHIHLSSFSLPAPMLWLAHLSAPLLVHLFTGLILTVCLRRLRDETELCLEVYLVWWGRWTKALMTYLHHKCSLRGEGGESPKRGYVSLPEGEEKSYTGEDWLVEKEHWLTVGWECRKVFWLKRKDYVKIVSLNTHVAQAPNHMNIWRKYILLERSAPNWSGQLLSLILDSAHASSFPERLSGFSGPSYMGDLRGHFAEFCKTYLLPHTC